MEDLSFKYSLNIALNVRKGQKAIDFYQKTLGLGLVSLAQGDSDTEMSAGPLSLWIGECSETEEDHVGKVFFEFETNNLEKAKEKLKEDGVLIGEATEGPDFKGFMAADPYGMRFHCLEKIK